MEEVYKVWCEWDMGFGWEHIVYSSKEKAEAAIESADWEGLVEMTLDEVREEDLVLILTVEVV